jgi:hypothetical protein
MIHRRRAATLLVPLVSTRNIRASELADLPAVFVARRWIIRR